MHSLNDGLRSVVAPVKATLFSEVIDGKKDCNLWPEFSSVSEKDVWTMDFVKDDGQTGHVNNVAGSHTVSVE